MLGGDDASGPEGLHRELVGRAGRWVHPSELGWRRRQLADRRRSRKLVTAVLIGGGALLLASTVMPWCNAMPDPVTGSPAPISAGIVEVQPLDDHAATVTGLVLDARGHVIVPLGAVEGSDRFLVRCGESMSTADLVAADPVRDLAILVVDSPAGEPLSTTAFAPGDELTLTTFTGDGRRWAHPVVVAHVGGRGPTSERTGQTAAGAAGETTVTGPPVDHGVLTTSGGEVTGWVRRSDRGGDSATLRVEPVDAVILTANRMLVEHHGLPTGWAASAAVPGGPASHSTADQAHGSP